MQINNIVFNLASYSSHYEYYNFWVKMCFVFVTHYSKVCVTN
jgi:hypothetical protein